VAESLPSTIVMANSDTEAESLILRARRSSDEDDVNDEDDAFMIQSAPSSSSLKMRRKSSDHPQSGTMSTSNSLLKDRFAEDVVHHEHLVSYDPFSPMRSSAEGKPSLLDCEDDETEIVFTSAQDEPLHPFLEMEKSDTSFKTPERPSPYEPVRTTSGLLLTHRRTPYESGERKRDGNTLYPKRSPLVQKMMAAERLEVENNWSSSSISHYYGGNFSFVQQSRKLLTYARIGVLVSALVMIIGTGVLVHHLRSDTSHLDSKKTSESSPTAQSNSATSSSSSSKERVILLPLPRNSLLRTPSLTLPHSKNNNAHNQHNQNHLHLFQSNNHNTQAKHGHTNQHTNHHQNNGHQNHRMLADLRNQFEDWVSQHGKQYHSHDEKEKRFHVWTSNHHKIIEKNHRHGPCKLTQQPVFGSNLFQDLTDEEFKESYLTGYTGPTTDVLEKKLMQDSGVLGEQVTANRHPEVHRKVMEKWKEPYQGGSRGYANCDWYDVSCILQYLFEYYLYGIGATMEPAYDSSSYPTCEYLALHS
jgi:hypothetical protein